jgi:small subunit ribosomal protein S6
VQEYETVFILDPGLDENQVNEEVQKVEGLISGHGGKVLDTQRWGRKRLAYEIRRKRDGVYTLIKHESSGESVKELERRLRLDENVMRVLTVIVGPEWEMPAEGEGDNAIGRPAAASAAAAAAAATAPAAAAPAAAAPATAPVAEGADA